MKFNVHPFPAPGGAEGRGVGDDSASCPIVPSAARGVASTAVKSDTSVPMPSMKANPFTSAVASAKRMNAVMKVTTFGVDDRGKAPSIPRRDSRDDRSSSSDLLLDALEDDDVRVGGHPDREGSRGRYRQREGDGDELDQGKQIGAVDEQAADGDGPEHAVEEQ